MAFTREIDVYNTIGIGYFAVTGEAVENERKSLVTFDITRALEKFIEHGAD